MISYLLNNARGVEISLRKMEINTSDLRKMKITDTMLYVYSPNYPYGHLERSVNHRNHPD